jgi:hypothetical protein
MWRGGRAWGQHWGAALGEGSSVLLLLASMLYRVSPGRGRRIEERERRKVRENKKRKKKCEQNSGRKIKDNLWDQSKNYFW